MRVWKVVLLVNLALAVGLGAGYLWRGRQLARLAGEITLERVTPVEREWRVRGVVRAVLPDLGIVVVTHEEIPGYMPSMTMGFRAQSPKIYEGVQVGDDVRFTLRGTPPTVVVTAIEKLPS